MKQRSSDVNELVTRARQNPTFASYPSDIGKLKQIMILNFVESQGAGATTTSKAIAPKKAGEQKTRGERLRAARLNSRSQTTGAQRRAVSLAQERNKTRQQIQNKERTSLLQGTSRTVASLALPMPKTLTNQHNIQYNQESLSVAAAASRIGRDLTDLITGNNASESAAAFTSIAKELGIALGARTLDGLGSAIGVNLNSTAVISKLTRQVLNPVVSTLFKSHGIRSFTFDWTFAPKSAQESRDLKNIIDTITINAHGSLGDNGRFLGFPNEVDVVFMTMPNQTENSYISKLIRSVVTNISVNPVAAGVQSFHRDIGDGAPPTMVNVSITLTETTPLNREIIQALDGV